MFDLTRPDAITSIATKRKVWHIEPGTLEIHGQVLRSRLAGCGQSLQIHLDAVETVLSEPAAAER